MAAHLMLFRKTRSIRGTRPKKVITAVAEAWVTARQNERPTTTSRRTLDGTYHSIEGYPSRYRILATVENKRRAKMIKGRRDGLQVLKDGSVKLTVSISKEDLPEAVNINDLFITADMPKQEIDAEEIRKRCMEAFDKAMAYIRGESEEQAILSLAIEGEGYDRNASFKDII